MIPFTIKQIEIFYAVANQLSFTDASKSLHLTQPAVSRQINNLEIQCGTPLFEQIGKKIYLTELGNLLFQQAKKIIEEFELLKISVAEKNIEITGTLNLCVTNGLQHLIFDAIGLFYEKYPKIELKISVGNSNFIFPSFSKNEIDFCIISNNALNKLNLVCDFLTKVPLALVVSSKNPLAKKRSIKLQALSKETFIVGEEETTCYDCSINVIKKLKPSPKIIQIKNFESIKYAIKSNIGIAFIPPSLVPLELKEKSLIAISINGFVPYSYEIYWAQHVNKSIPPVARIFKKFLFETLSNKK